ncbi:MAG: hypothetical protein IJZ85_11570 [Lachnospiraceae bacterium]|nr:hypothetical protein [Lachnospiraceae bacterium]
MSKKNLSGLSIAIITLALSSAVLASFDCYSYCTYLAWSQKTYIGQDNFWAELFYFCGLIEIILVFRNRTFQRIIGCLLTLAKIILPWLVLYSRQIISDLISDHSTSTRIDNALPYIITVLCIISFVLYIVSLRKIHQEKLYAENK